MKDELRLIWVFLSSFLRFEAFFKSFLFFCSFLGLVKILNVGVLEGNLRVRGFFEDLGMVVVEYGVDADEC